MDQRVQARRLLDWSPTSEMWRGRFISLLYMLYAPLKRLGIEKLPGIRVLKEKSRQLLFSLLAPGDTVLIRVPSARLHVPASACNSYMRNFEGYTTYLFREAIKPGATVVDIGANIGYFSIIGAQKTGSHGKVYAFEPAPDNFLLLRKNVQLCGAVNTTCIQKAVAGERKSTTLFEGNHPGQHSLLLQPYTKTGHTRAVECVTLDEYLGGQTIGVIKMDIEGYEYFALQGMPRTIANSNDCTLFTELFPRILRSIGIDPMDFLARLSRLGFDLQMIVEDNQSLQPITAEVLRRAEAADPEWYTNLLCVKRGSVKGARNGT
jgi:FkbM family methyltransferase